MKKDKKEQINQIIYERAYEIEEILSKDDFFGAKMAGVPIEQISDVALKIAVREIVDTMQKQIQKQIKY